MEYSIEIKQSDLEALQRSVARRRNQSKRTSRFGMLILWGFLAAVFVFVLSKFQPSSAVWVGLLIGIGFTYFSLVLHAKRMYRYDPDGYVLGPQQIKLTEQGIETAKKMSSSVTRWSAVQAIDETKDHIFIFVDTIVAHVIPKRYFESDQLIQPFRELLHEYAPRVESTSSETSTTVNADTSYNLSSFPFLQNLLAGAGFALFCRGRLDKFCFRLSQIAIFVLLEVAATVLYDYIAAGEAPSFNSYAITEHATGYLLFLLSAFFIARLMGKQDDAQKLVLILMTVFPVTWGVYICLDALLPQVIPGSLVVLQWLLFLGFTGWMIAIAFRAIRMLFGGPLSTAMRVTALYALMNFGPLLVLPHSQFWYSDNTSEYTDYSKIDVEDTYYRQPSLLHASQVQLQRPGLVDLYFVGFGSYASQDVFMSEVNFTKQLFDTKFGTADRSVSLINNEKTLDHIPLATGSNLRLVLQDIGTKMDIEEDMLFLFMTSHGSKDATLSSQFWPLDPNDVTAQELRVMLDESTIKWRVIVISACYSGSFIKHLQNDNTLIITAAHKDKQSFGCSTKRKFTYFGEAYFSEALQNSYSFVDAFESAAVAITDREQEESKIPSEPQIYIGSHISGKLAELEKGFERLQ